MADTLPLHGFTEETPKNMMLDAGIVVSGFDISDLSFDAIIGCTHGGNELEIIPNVIDLEADGVLVATEGMTQKFGETMQLKTNLVEVTKENLTRAIIGKAGTGATNFDEVVSKGKIDAGDYEDNLAFIGRKMDQTPVIVVMEKALCTNGLKLSTKDKEQSDLETIFKCYAKGDAKDLSVLPYHIYTAKATA